MTLSKQVRSLQMLRYGELQWQHQHIGPSDGNAAVPKYIQPNQVQPFAFCLNDLYNQSKIWYGTMSGGTPVLHVGAAWAKVVTDTAVDDEFLWNLKQGQDHVNVSHFMPVSTSIRFSIQNVIDASPTTTHTVKIQIFKIKNANTNGSIQVGMPHTLGAYWHMCDDNPVQRNHFNTAQYHTLLQTKTVNFYPTDHSRANTTKYCTVKMNFKPKELQPEITDDDPADQTFHSNVPTKDQIWCLISTNSAPGQSHFCRALEPLA